MGELGSRNWVHRGVQRCSRAARDASSRLPAAWHAACCVWLSSGCFYVAPIVQTPENSAPVILIPTSLVNDLEMEANPESLEVMAYDPELDDLYFLWSVPHSVEFEQLPVVQVGDLKSSVIKVPRDALLDGDQIVCSVSDAVSPERTQVVIWNITVQQ